MGSLLHPVAAPDLPDEEFRATNHADRRAVRLLLITDTDLVMRGGSERFLTHLLQALDPRRFEIDLIQLARAASGNGADAAPRFGHEQWRIEYRPVGAIYTLKGWKLWREIRARVRAGRYDIIQSQHEKADLLTALMPRGSGRTLRISNRRDTGFQKSPTLRLLFRLLNHRYDRVVAPSRAILEQLIRHEGVDRRRTRWLPNGVDCERYRPLERPERIDGRRRAGLPVDAYLIGCAARMVPVKRHEDLVAAFARVAAAHPDAMLALAGGGPLEQAIRAQVDRSGVRDRILFLGDGCEIPQLLPLFDAFALASSTEGMSNAILEAMACGLPVVATDVGGNPELVQPGLTGYLVPPFQPVEFAVALSDLLARRDHGRSMGDAARLRAQTTFSLPTMIESFSSLYLTGHGKVRT